MADTELIHFRLTQVEEKVNKVEEKLGNVITNTAVLKTELSQATGKQSSAISAVISLAIGLTVAFAPKLFG